MTDDQGSISKRTAVKRVACICLVVQILLISNASYGAEKTIGWENGGQCKFETRFDPAKYDEEKLRNTTNVLFMDGFYKSPSLVIGLSPGGYLRSNMIEYQQACQREKERTASLPVIDLSGIENFRKWSLEALEDECRFNMLQARAAEGNPAALWEFTPSAPKCSFYIEALEGKTNLRSVWREMIDSRCRSFSNPAECRANFLKAESKPSPEDAIKRDVLLYGWTNCSTAYLKANDLRLHSSMLNTLEKNFRRRFKVKAFPCAD